MSSRAILQSSLHISRRLFISSMHMHYAFESVCEFLHSFTFVLQKVCRICRSRRFVLESSPRGVIVVPIEVMAQLILTVHGWKGEKRGGKASSVYIWFSGAGSEWVLWAIGQTRWCHRFSQVNAIVHLVAVQWFTVCISGDGCSVMSCFCVSLCTLQRMSPQQALGPSRPAEPWNFSVLEVF